MKKLTIILLGILYMFVKSDIKNSLKEKLKSKLKVPYIEFVLLKNINTKIKYDKKIENIIEKEYGELYYDFQNPYIKLNPYVVNPLSAIIKFQTEEPIKIELILKDKYSLGNNYVKQFNEFKTEHSCLL